MVKNCNSSVRISRKKLQTAYPLVKLLLRLNSQDRQHLLQYLNSEACDVICECIHNSITNKDLKCRKSLCEKTKSEKDTIRYLVNPKHKVDIKRKKLVQIGGNPLGLILSVALPLLAQFLGI